jgi:hypothetical protein
MKKESILKLIKRPTYFFVALATTILLFDVQFYMLKILPGNINQSCYPGAYFTSFNIFFAFIISALIALNLIGFIHLIHSKVTNQLAVTGPLSLIGFIFAAMTSFCTLCVIPVISLFGISISLTFFTDYIELFKLLSLTALIISTYLLNKQIQKNCSWCIK